MNGETLRNRSHNKSTFGMNRVLCCVVETRQVIASIPLAKRIITLALCIVNNLLTGFRGFH